MLRITNLVSCIGNVEVIKRISLHVREGEIATLIGANGAGKSTLLNTIAGLIVPKEGTVEFEHKNVAGLPAMHIVRRGISLVPEGRQLFASMSVIDNLLLGGYTQFRRISQAEMDEQLRFVFDLFPILKNREQQLAGTLSGGQQQMLAIARAMMSRPKMILLDEPSMGLAPKVVEEIFETIQMLRNRDLTVLLVEQNARLALETADRGYVLETGQIVMEGPCADLKRNREIERAYLGKTYKEIWE